ncbi:MAG: lamin tail domain-containing protein, partial [Acidobacteria bacterium]|nr:lamin tail domain-containing protein [Acidobacteriota bacterium]
MIIGSAYDSLLKRSLLSLIVGLSLITTAIIIFFVVLPSPAHGLISTNLVISEFRVRGPAGGNDEFIELYNLSSVPVDFSGWKIRGSNSAGTVGDRATIPAGIIIQPGCHYLLTNAGASGYSGTVPGDQTYTTGITDDGGIALTLPDNTIIDQVGMSAGSAFKEGTPLANLGTTNLNRGYERKPGGTAGSGTDSDDNSSDFQLITPSDPQSSTSGCIGSGTTNPTGIGAANPNPVSPGNNTLLSLTVTPGANPTSTGIAVTGDLTAIGGGSTQTFFNDGTNGDVTAGDNIFSFLATVSTGITPGLKSLPLNITDAQARTGMASISLNVQAPALVVISQIYGGGGNSGAVLTNDFIEIFNRGATPVDLTGWSVQYASSAGTTWMVTPISGTLAPGQYYLVQEASGGTAGSALPAPDATGSINMAAGMGKVALVSTTTPVTGSGCPFGASVVDFIGYGSANCFEGG